MDSLKINNEGLNLVKSFEGCRLTAYKCPAGVWTIGYGHTGKVDGKAICAGMTITEAKATELLKQDMTKFENAVLTCSELTFKPNENQFSALVSFAFNCGAGNLKTLVKGRSAAVVAEKLLLYNKANGKVLSGLTRRRKAERELFLKAVSKTETTAETGVAKNATATSEVSFEAPTIKKGSTGKAVKIWQIIVGVEPDGDFGTKTRTATIEFQRKYKLAQDGVVGKNSWSVGLETL